MEEIIKSNWDDDIIELILKWLLESFDLFIESNSSEF